MTHVRWHMINIRMMFGAVSDKFFQSKSSHRMKKLNHYLTQPQTELFALDNIICEKRHTWVLAYPNIPLVVKGRSQCLRGMSQLNWSSPITRKTEAKQKAFWMESIPLQGTWPLEEGVSSHRSHVQER